MPISEVFLIDCLEYMKGLPDKFFDLAIVDPPFGIGNWWEKSKHTKHYCQKKWNESPPGPEYFAELFRISTNQIIWGGNYFSEHLPPTNAWIVWDKLMSENQNVSDCELAWTSFSASLRKITVRWSGACKDEQEFMRIHPSQRPIKLHTKTLDLRAKPGDKIFDSHMGSQSSRIAAYDMGFDYWGCELDPDYFAAGCKRFEEHKLQLKLL